MSTRYIYPEQKFKISIDLEVDVNFIGMWDGISTKVFDQIYQEMLSDGDFSELLKSKILEHLSCETFDCYNLEPFDRLCFGVDEYSGE